MTPAEFREARHALGLSGARLAAAVGIGDSRTIRRYEAGEREIPGPVAVLMRLLLASPAARRFVGIHQRDAA